MASHAAAQQKLHGVLLTCNEHKYIHSLHIHFNFSPLQIALFTIGYPWSMYTIYECECTCTLYIIFCCLRVCYSRQSVSFFLLSFHLSNVTTALQRAAMVLQYHKAWFIRPLKVLGNIQSLEKNKSLECQHDPFTKVYCVLGSHLSLQGTHSKPNFQLCSDDFRQTPLSDTWRGKNTTLRYR